MKSLKNKLLISMPNMVDPYFAKSVIFICEDDKNGTCKIQLTVYTRDLGQIIRLLGKMESIAGVYNVRRKK